MKSILDKTLPKLEMMINFKLNKSSNSEVVLSVIYKSIDSIVIKKQENTLFTVVYYKDGKIAQSENDLFQEQIVHNIKRITTKKGD